MEIEFIRDYQVKAAGGDRYAAGDIVDLDISSAEHFIRRGAAKPHIGKPVPEKAPPAAEKPVEKETKQTRPKKMKGQDEAPAKFKKAQDDYRKKELSTEDETDE